MRREEPCDSVAVTVTFLRMDAPPVTPAPPLPEKMKTEALAAPTVGFYRYLYNTVGRDYVWWLRRIMPDDDLTILLRDPWVGLHVLYKDGEPAGFFELDGRYGHNVNISYFGLMPHMIGTGAGPGFLRQAIDAAWACGPRTVTVNTCTADHPRALPNYIRAGFKPLRAVREVWDVPCHLGLRIPDHLRV
ncbi:MAG: GNAT family N-acetyltransferase [Acetobacteraceae bacterium]|nr:GNAT family N-acetyltransferase [Acetobacteraceae bacterium]